MSIAKFKVEFISNMPPQDERVKQLGDWCHCFNKRGLTPRFNGTGRALGNLSFRFESGGSSFIITGSALDSKEKLGHHDFVRVVESYPEKMEVVAEGKRDPSSESMMHYEIYRRRSDVNAIFHGHDKEITVNASLLGLPETGKEELPGTVELMREVIRILDNNNFIVMKNHGFLALGKNMDEAGSLSLLINERLNELKDDQ
jgi:ribulose-5-phosphate 4-epimerase/fuculose-1-phosphate aldolase